MSETATEIAMDMRNDLRRQRVDALVHATMMALDRYIPDVSRRDAYYVLVGAFMDMGVDFVTDDMRRDAGLPPRDDKGWTREELAALELRRMEILTKPLTMVVPSKDVGDTT